MEVTSSQYKLEHLVGNEDTENRDSEWGKCEWQHNSDVFAR